MEIYWGSGSPYSWSVLLALEIKELKYESKMIQFSKKEHKTEEFFKMNRRGKVPVLKDGDFVVYESLAVIEYLEKKKPEPSLFGKTPKESAIIMQVVSEILNYQQPHSGEAIRPVFFKKIQGNEEKISRALSFLHQELKYYEDRLKKSAWLVGETVSVADVMLFPSIQLLMRAAVKEDAKPLFLGLSPLEEFYPSIARWCETVKGLKGYEKTYPPHWRKS